MEFFKIKRDIPFMRHALVFNVVSFLTFAAAVFFLFSRGLHLSVEFTGGTLMEVSYSQPADLGAVRGAIAKLGYQDVQVQNFGTARDVLINERVREELRNGASPQAAIHAGYDRAWATILDSNVTTLIAGLALLAFGSGPVRGFAVVHCLGILTSMFSAVFFSRGLVNLWYGRQKKLQTVSIGTVWRPEGGNAVAPRD